MEEQAAVEQVWVAVRDPLDRPSREALEKLTIPHLYEILERMEEQKSVIQSIRESIRGQVALLQTLTDAISSIRGGKVSYQQANEIIQDCETEFLRLLQEGGLTVQYESEISPEELRQKPALILMTHQGGGGENYIHQAMTGVTGRLIVKSSLMKIPYIRDGLEARHAVLVEREMLKDSETRRREIGRIAREIVEQLSSGDNMFIFFEGTRSRSGEVASTEKRRAWTKDLLTAVDQFWAEKHNGQKNGTSEPENFQKLLLVFNTKTAMPDAPEEKLFLTRFRTDGTILSARLLKADDLAIEESEDPYDPTTLFGKARSILKEMLIRIVLDRGKMRI